MILITGAKRGLGASIAALLEKKYPLFLHLDRSQADFSTEEGVEAFLETVPTSKITALINNVGNFEHPTMQSNFFAAKRLTEALLPSIEASKGHIINIGTAGVLQPTVSCTDYAITKAALWSYTLSLAKQKPGVKVNMVSPGVLENSVGDPDARRIPLVEVAKLVAFLLESDYITGQNIDIASGFRL